MWLETIEEGFVNTDHILRIYFEVSDTPYGESVGLSAEAGSGKEFYILGTAALKFYCKEDDEDFNEAVKKNPWGVMILINDRIFNAMVTGKKILTIEEMRKVGCEAINNLLQKKEKHESGNGNRWVWLGG